MEKKNILHMLTTAKHLSPFDANMAVDAGFEVILSYQEVVAAEISALVQDAIFSRGPNGVKHTGIFIGGRDVTASCALMKQVSAAMVPPFIVSTMADPSGAYTTAAAMTAAVESKLGQQFSTKWSGTKTVVLGGTGPVGMTAAALAASQGAQVYLMSRSQSRAVECAELSKQLFADLPDLKIEGVANASKVELLSACDVVLAAAAAGVEILNEQELGIARNLKVVADVNAVPPSGVFGLDALHKGQALSAGTSHAVGFGALAIGNLKYVTQKALLKKMIAAANPCCLQYREAYESALEYAESMFCAES